VTRAVAGFGVSTKLEWDWSFLTDLRDRGRAAATTWLATDAAEAETRLAQVVTSPTSSAGSPEAKLNEARLALAASRAVNTETHPDVIALRRQIAALEREIGGGGSVSVAAAARREVAQYRERIHAIDDTVVASAPNFAAAWPDISAATSGAILIGHTLGFDVAVLKRECERAGVPWVAPRTLDTRLLAEVAEPHLGDYTLEHLASWLGVNVEGRHSAVGDATVTARIFLAMLPKLRQGNIRTLAEAEQACLTLSGVLEEQHRAGWEDAVAAPHTREERVLARIDAYPYRHRVADVMSAPPKFVAADVALDAVFPSAGTRLIFPELLAEGLEPHEVHQVYIHGAERPDTYVDIAETLDVKLAALRAHKSQMGEWDPVEMLTQWAAEQGRRRKLKAAESYRRMILQDL